jgi:hypothetical protein
MFTCRNLLHTVIYLGGAGLFIVGIQQFPSRPTVTTISGVSTEEASRAIDEQYSEIVKHSHALKYLVSGLGGIICNVGVQLLFRRGLRRVRPLQEPRIVLAAAPIAPPPAPPPPPILKEVVIHELHQPTWVEQVYIESKKRPSTPYPDPVL